MRKSKVSQSSQISISSKRQHIRLWFECLQICHSKDDYTDNLIGSREFYEEWGDVTSVKFDDWWKQKKHLFVNSVVKEVTKVSNTPNTITLSIPLNEKVTTITKEVKRIVGEKQSELLREMNIDPDSMKSKRLDQGKYSFTVKEIKGKFHYINLEVYKIYLELNKPPINREFLINIRKRFDDRYKSKLSRNIIWIPQMKDFESPYKTNGDCEDVIRTVRRGLKSVEKTLLNVSRGRFP
jgi:hypothetical protein